MPVRLRNPNNGFPAGGFVFHDPHTGMKFDGDNVDLNHQAKLVAEHRKGNPRIYKPDEPKHFDHAAISQEIIVQLCANAPQYCEDEARPGEPYPFVPSEPPPDPANIVRIQGKKCPKCQGQDFEAQYCKTCAGRRITGHRCVACGLVT